MTPRKSPHNEELPNDNRLSRMIALSAVLHLVVITALIISTTRSQADRPFPLAYTVSLVDPAALGTNLPGGGREKPAAARPQPPPEAKQPPAVKKEEPKAVPPPQPKETKPPPAVKKEEPIQPKETVKLPEKAKPEEKKPEPKPEPQRAAKETKKSEVKPEPPQPQTKPEEKKAEPTKTDTPAQSPEEREKQILAALERIKAKVDKNQPDARDSGSGSGSSAAVPGPGIKGSGPATLGGAPGQGGGGLVRGLDYIMYTEQVKRRVKESWIVAEKKSGLSAIVRFSVQPDGKMLGIELMKPSGDRAFDDSVLRAVNKANPLPPPPPAYQEEFATQKVEVTFHSEERNN